MSPQLYRKASKRVLSVLQRFGIAEKLGMDEVIVDSKHPPCCRLPNWQWGDICTLLPSACSAAKGLPHVPTSHLLAAFFYMPVMVDSGPDLHATLLQSPRRCWPGFKGQPTPSNGVDMSTKAK